MLRPSLARSDKMMSLPSEPFMPFMPLVPLVPFAPSLPVQAVVADATITIASKRVRIELPPVGLRGSRYTRESRQRTERRANRRRGFRVRHRPRYNFPADGHHLLGGAGQLPRAWRRDRQVRRADLVRRGP